MFIILFLSACSDKIYRKAGRADCGNDFSKHALAHEAGVKVVRGGEILRMWKVSLKKETYGGKNCHRITLKR